MNRKRIALLLALLLSLSACGQEPAQEGVASDLTPEQSVSEPAAEAEASTDPMDALPDGSTDPMDAAGEVSAPPREEEPAVESEAEPEEMPEEWDEETTFRYTLCFAGDINLAEGQYTTAALDAGGLESCVSETLRKTMTEADVLCVNNEFTYSNRGTPLEGKAFTFRANPSRVSVLEQLGVDVAVLANNHVFDYCEDALLDTLDTLSGAGIPYIGAGRDLEEASAVWYAELDNCTVAYIAASRVEWEAKTRPATSYQSGVFYTAYDTDLLVQRVQEAKEQADYVVVYMHWGIEGTSDLEGYQVDVGQLLAEAGADIVVGDHPHQLQGVRFEGEVPVFYSMGNYWFGRKDEYTMLLNVILSGDKYGVRQVEYQVVPARETGEAKVVWLDRAERRREMYDELCAMPYSSITIDDDGMLTKKE